MGAIGGGIWHGIKGARNSPRGERLVGSLSAIKARAPVLGGNFGVWGGLFSTEGGSLECYYCWIHDGWNFGFQV
jgi:import inner membrane translocase subunit TIM17